MQEQTQAVQQTSVQVSQNAPTLPNHLAAYLMLMTLMMATGSMPQTALSVETLSEVTEKIAKFSPNYITIDGMVDFIRNEFAKA